MSTGTSSSRKYKAKHNADKTSAGNNGLGCLVAFIVIVVVVVVIVLSSGIIH